MDRRSFLRISGGTTTLLVAGCTEGAGATETPPVPSEDLTGEHWENDSERRNVSEDLDAFGVTVVEHELVVEGGDVTVEGVVENNTGERLTYVEVGVTVKDEDGGTEGLYATNTTDLDDGGRWAFGIGVQKPAEAVDNYSRYVLDVSASDWEEDGVVIREHELVDTDDDGTWDTYTPPAAEGVAENTSGELLATVTVFVLPYDGNGTPLGYYADRTENLGDGETWAFEVVVIEDVDSIEEYDIGAKTW